MTDEDYEKSSKREVAVKTEIEKLSNDKLIVELEGYGAGIPKKFKTHIPYDPNAPRSLDLKIEDIAVIVEVMGSDRYTFKNSGFFPVAEDKVERARRDKANKTYFVFVLDLENQPNKWWINSKDCERHEIIKDFQTIYGPQDIYKTDKYAWTRELGKLVKELLKFKGHSHQKTLM